MSSSFTIDGALALIVPGILFLLLLAGALWLSRHTDFVAILRQHLHRYAPFYFVMVPPAVTYFAFCGAASGGAAILFFNSHSNDISQMYANSSQKYAIQHGLFTQFHWTEYTCSFLGTFGFAWLIRWVGLPRLWLAMLFVSMSVCAAYRTARVGSGPNFGSGPEILRSPQWLDVIPVALGLGLFLLLQSRARKMDTP